MTTGLVETGAQSGEAQAEMPDAMLDSQSRRIRVESERAHRVLSLREEVSAALRTDGDRPIVLELCCGHGHFLTAQAERDVSRCFVGVDYCSDRISRARRKQERGGWGHLRFLRAEVFEFLDAWPADVPVETCFMLFPDPWPKKRHSKNRLFCRRLLDRLHPILRDGAAFFFRTDADFYFEDALRLLSSDGRWDPQEEPRWPFDVDTVFQRRAVAYRTLACVKRPKAR